MVSSDCGSSHCGTRHFRYLAAKMDGAAKMDLTQCKWISQQEFVIFTTNDTAPQNPVVSDIWEDKWRHLPWERKRVNATTKDPELLLQYHDLHSTKMLYELCGHLRSGSLGSGLT